MRWGGWRLAPSDMPWLRPDVPFECFGPVYPSSDTFSSQWRRSRLSSVLCLWYMPCSCLAPAHVCVLSALAVELVKLVPSEKLQKATFGAGCFWGPELAFQVGPVGAGQPPWFENARIKAAGQGLGALPLPVGNGDCLGSRMVMAPKPVCQIGWGP